jgi:PIN domain nuclease of toxin-antitoxin system
VAPAVVGAAAVAVFLYPIVLGRERLPHHGDPFDRLLAAQAQVENMSLISTDAIFDQYEINLVW